MIPTTPPINLIPTTDTLIPTESHSLSCSSSIVNVPVYNDEVFGSSPVKSNSCRSCQNSQRFFPTNRGFFTHWLYEEPPDKEENYDRVPTCIRTEYAKQAELLYREILKRIRKPEMAKINAEFKCGINKDTKAKCAIDDGPMAVYCLLAKYGRNDAHSMTDLENQFIRSPGHFRTGPPIQKISKLRGLLTQALQMGLQLKSSQCMAPIIDILSERHPKFAVQLSKYEDGGPTPNDCAGSLDQMYSDIERACEGIERAHGDQN